jgi:DNA-binding transcriptional LysR family regulator
MDLRSLRHVAALARRLSYTRAAEELGLSQSALSRSIQAIEQRAGVRLFDRDRAGVHPTAVGRAVAERAAAVLREADDLDRLLRGAARGSQGEVAFGMAPLLAAALAPAALTEALEATPELRSRVLVRAAEDLFALLLAERIEFLVCAEGQAPPGAPVKGELLGRFPTSLLVRAGHPLLSPEPPARGAYPLVVSAPFERQQGFALGPGAQIEGPPRVVLEDHGALLRITEASDAVWLSSAFATADEILQGRLCELPWPARRGQSRFRVVMYSLDRRSLSPGALQFKARFRARIRWLAQSLPPSRGDGGAESAPPG